MIQVIVSMDSNLFIDAGRISEIQGTIAKQLSRFEDWLPRIVVHVHEIGPISGQSEICCLMEVQPVGLSSVYINKSASSLKEAVSQATDELKQVLDRAMGRLLGLADRN